MGRELSTTRMSWLVASSLGLAAAVVGRLEAPGAMEETGEGGEDRSQLIFNKWSQLNGGDPGTVTWSDPSRQSEVVGGLAMRRKINLLNTPPPPSL